MKLSKKPIEYIIHPEGSQIYDENAISIKSVDEGGGIFFEISNINKDGLVRADLSELEMLVEIARSMNI